LTSVSDESGITISVAINRKEQFYQRPSLAIISTMSRLCVHTITTKPLSFEQCLAEFPMHGVSGITIWRQALEGRDLNAVKRQTAELGMDVVSLCRGGFFPAESAADRQKAIDDNLLAIEQAPAVSLPAVVTDNQAEVLGTGSPS
jgi:hypothetical protein